MYFFDGNRKIHYRAVSIKTPPLVLLKSPYFEGVLLSTKNSEFFDPGVFIIYKIIRNSSGVFIIYKIYRQNRPSFGTFLGGFPLNNKQKPQTFSRASRAGVKGFFIFFRGYYYLQKFSSALRAGFLLSTKSPKNKRGGY